MTILEKNIPACVSQRAPTEIKEVWVYSTRQVFLDLRKPAFQSRFGMNESDLHAKQSNLDKVQRHE